MAERVAVNSYTKVDISYETDEVENAPQALCERIGAKQLRRMLYSAPDEIFKHCDSPSEILHVGRAAPCMRFLIGMKTRAP